MARLASAAACRPTRSRSTRRRQVVRERNRARGAPVPPKVVAAPAARGGRGARRARPARASRASTPPGRSSSCRPPSSTRPRRRAPAGGPLPLELRPADLALRLGGPRRRPRRRSPRRTRGRGGRLHVPVGDGPLPPDPAGRARVGGHARELHDARLPRRRDVAGSGSARSSPASPTATSRTSPRSWRRSTCSPAAARCAGSAPAGSSASTRSTAGTSRRCATLRAARGRARAAAADVGAGRAALRGPHDHRRARPTCYPRPLQERVPSGGRRREPAESCSWSAWLAQERIDRVAARWSAVLRAAPAAGYAAIARRPASAGSACRDARAGREPPEIAVTDRRAGRGRRAAGDAARRGPRGRGAASRSTSAAPRRPPPPDRRRAIVGPATRSGRLEPRFADVIAACPLVPSPPEHRVRTTEAPPWT